MYDWSHAARWLLLLSPPSCFLFELCGATLQVVRARIRRHKDSAGVQLTVLAESIHQHHAKPHAARLNSFVLQYKAACLYLLLKHCRIGWGLRAITCRGAQHNRRCDQRLYCLPG